MFILFLGVCDAAPSTLALPNLQSSRPSPRYNARPVHAAQLFAKFCSGSGHDLHAVWILPRDANDALIAYVQFTFDARRPLWLASHAILAMQASNRLLKGQLRPACDSIQTGKLSMPVKSRHLCLTNL